MKKTNTEEISTLIGEGTIFTGNLSFDGTVRLDGLLKGIVESPDATLVIGKTGRVEGDISVKDLIVMGSAKGKYFISGLTRFIAGSRVEGELQTKELNVEPGAVFDGTCVMTKDVPKVESPAVRHEPHRSHRK
jgi:cytoskeletal protein CcmA (bactofilin family)